MTPYFFKQMRKRTSLCLVVVLTALAFSLALCMLQRSRDQMAARIEEVYDNLEVRCSVTNLTGTQSDQLNLPVKFIGVGEQADDLMPFVAWDFVNALI